MSVLKKPLARLAVSKAKEFILLFFFSKVFFQSARAPANPYFLAMSRIDTLTRDLPELPPEFNAVFAELLSSNKSQLCSMNQVRRNKFGRFGTPPVQTNLRL